jgi:hypothetical protein
MLHIIKSGKKTDVSYSQKLVTDGGGMLVLQNIESI